MFDSNGNLFVLHSTYNTLVKIDVATGTLVLFLEVIISMHFLGTTTNIAGRSQDGLTDGYASQLHCMCKCFGIQYS